MRPLYPGTDSDLGGRVLGEVENNFLPLPAEGDAADCVFSPQVNALKRRLIGMVQRGCGQMVDILLIGWE